MKKKQLKWGYLFEINNDKWLRVIWFFSLVAGIITIDVSIRNTASEILAKVEKITNFAASRYYLYSGSSRLSPNESLASQGVKESDELTMMKAPVVNVRLPTGNYCV